MNDHWNTQKTDGLTLESNDSSTSAEPFVRPPFAELVQPVPAAEPDDTFRTLNPKALARLRNSPAAKLLDGSPWVLKACQLDMDSPPSLVDYIDQRCEQLLEQHGAGHLSPEHLHLEFLTDLHPGVAADGFEQYQRRVSVKELTRIALDPAAFLGLTRNVEADRVLHPDAPSLTLKHLVRLITQSTWASDYQARLDAFWSKHSTTYRLLAKLSFIDGLAHLRGLRKISPEGYALALDALGLATFPQSLDLLKSNTAGQRSTISLVMLDDQVVPGIFQLKSKNTDHCYLHTLGEWPECTEYISSQEPWREAPLLEALNRSSWHRHHLDLEHLSGEAPTLTMIECTVDLFTALTQAQQGFSDNRLALGSIEVDLSDMPEENETLLMPIDGSLKLVSSIDFWGEQSEIRTRVPDPLRTANRLMQRFLKTHNVTDVKPQQVFICYRRGTSITPLGNARAPVTAINVPDPVPVPLGRALLDNYRVERPVGYIDHDGRTVVYNDPTGEGKWAAQNELAISADAIEQHIRGIDFLAVMSDKLKHFWDRKSSSVELALRRTFIAQALVSLKRDTLSRTGFDLLVEALEEPGEGQPRTTRCSALGFHVQRSLIPGSHCMCCIGLLVFSHDKKPGRVLYQAGQEEPFIEFNTRGELGAHLQRAAAHEHWRTTLLNYMPHRLHSRLSYLLTLWGQVRSASEPGSHLRPWLDALYHEDVHKTKAGSFCEHAVTLSPFAFMCQVMRSNSLNDAQDSVTTSAQVSLRDWTQRLNHLQLMLSPLSLLLSPAAVASLALTAGTLYLNGRSVALPGSRDKEKRQLLLTALSLGLFQTGALTPRLLRALRTVTTLHRSAAPVAPTIGRGFSSLLQRSMGARKTQLQRFFGHGSLLKTWIVPGHPHFATLPVRAWKLEHKFLLWTSEQAQARTLVVSTHGYHLPWTRTTAIPNGTELRTYVPHGFELVDPRLHRVVSQNIQPFSFLNPGQNTPGPAFSQLPAWQLTDKALAGTSQVGNIKNYTLGKFQSERYESYRDIGNVVRHSRQSPFFGQLMPTPMDVLTVRNRFGMRNPTLQDLFGALNRQGIHYDHILLLHCRCSAVSSMLGRAPAFHAPVGSVPISP